MRLSSTRRSLSGWGLACVFFLLVALGSAGPGVAKLDAQVTSPGDLSRAHEDLSGTCSQCHAPGSRTASDQRCLSCHTPLAARIEARAGYHADRGVDCASCHREHRGRDASIAQFESAGFRHATVGYPLKGGHVEVACSGCHNTLGVRDREVRLFKGRYGALNQTHLGLDKSCATCHVSRDPHVGQFEGRECATCHDETVWAPAVRFDHANARYPLTGRHAPVECGACHESSSDRSPSPQRGLDAGSASATAYRPLEFGQCSSCHRDEHAGEMGASCASCHSTGGWGRIPRRRFEGDFDHAATTFPLDGRHAAAQCTSCHRERPKGDPSISLTFTGRALRSYPTPVAETCASCHLDYHDEAFEPTVFAGACETCHTSGGWAPSQFDLFMHDRSRFELIGAHRVVPCGDCHARADRLDDAGDDAGDAAGDAADGSGAEEVGAAAGQALPGFTIHLGPLECAACHEADDPHAGQFMGQGCASCHDTGAFNEASFDHATARFSLEGAHEEVSCAACHVPESSEGGPPVIRYRPLAMECRSCHG